MYNKSRQGRKERSQPVFASFVPAGLDERLGDDPSVKTLGYYQKFDSRSAERSDCVI